MNDYWRRKKAEIKYQREAIERRLMLEKGGESKNR